MPKARAAAGAALALGLLLYPLVIYFGLGALGPRRLALVLLVAVAARLALRPTRGAAAMLALLPLAVAGVLAGFVLLSGTATALLYYPVGLNLALFLVFGATLVRPPSLVERLARLRRPDLPAGAIGYTRTVTAVWCGFFMVNGAIALATALMGDVEAWTLYNGLIAYAAIAAVAGGELLIRHRRQRTAQP